MAKHKTVTHVPAPPWPATPAPTTRLAAQLFVALGELVMVAISIVGIVTIVGWLIGGAEMRSKSTPTHRAAPTELVYWVDRRYGEMCEPVNRLPPVRRHYARDVY